MGVAGPFGSYPRPLSSQINLYFFVVKIEKVWVDGGRLTGGEYRLLEGLETLILQITIHDSIQFHDYLNGRLGTSLTNSKAALVFSSGESFTHSTGKWSYREQLFDRRHDHHEETVTGQETGKLIFARRCPLSEKDKYPS